MGLQICSTHETLSMHTRSHNLVKMHCSAGKFLKNLPLPQPSEPPCLGVLYDHFVSLLCDACMPGRTCWGLDVNTSQKQTPTLMYRAPLTPFVEITVCCMATLNPIRERFSFLSCGFAASADYSFARSGELLFLFTAAHMLEATRFSIKSPCFFIASLFSVQ